MSGLITGGLRQAVLLDDEPLEGAEKFKYLGAALELPASYCNVLR